MTSPRLRGSLDPSDASAFQVLVDAAPDAIIVVSLDGRVLDVNPCAVELFGYERDEFVGMPVEALVPDGLQELHAQHRRNYIEHPASRPMGAGRDLFGLRADGELVPVDIGLTPIQLAQGPAVAAFVRDATERRSAEQQRRRSSESADRRRQALELNDNVVQGLVSLLWRLDRDDATGAREIAEATLRSARRMMADLLRDLDEDIDPGALVRGAPASVGAPPSATPARASRNGHVRVVIADDAADLRTLIRLRLEQQPGVVVVGEASDGQEAIELARSASPDVVVLDLGMPRVDGLEATARILAERPGCRIIVLSGYPQAALRERVLALGAIEYLEKEADLDGLVSAVLEHGLARSR